MSQLPNVQNQVKFLYSLLDHHLELQKYFPENIVKQRINTIQSYYDRHVKIEGLPALSFLIQKVSQHILSLSILVKGSFLMFIQFFRM